MTRLMLLEISNSKETCQSYILYKIRAIVVKTIICYIIESRQDSYYL